MKSLKDKKVTFKIDTPRFDLLTDYADREGTTVSAYIRHLIIRNLEERSRFDLHRFTANVQEQR